MTVRSGYLGKVGLMYLLTFADLVINGLADHNAVADAADIMPFLWIGCVGGGSWGEGR
jgi:hypothetical protein